MRSLRVVLTIIALRVGIFAGDGYDWATNPDRVWARQAADAAIYARTEIHARTIQSAMDPPGTRYILPHPQQGTQP